jgi:hypothetical protein
MSTASTSKKERARVSVPNRMGAQSRETKILILDMIASPHLRSRHGLDWRSSSFTTEFDKFSQPPPEPGTLAGGSKAKGLSERPQTDRIVGRIGTRTGRFTEAAAAFCQRGMLRERCLGSAKKERERPLTGVARSRPRYSIQFHTYANRLSVTFATVTGDMH